MNDEAPQEPPVGTVLETRDDIDEYRIERLPDGWAIQYRDGENEYGYTHTGSRVSWRSAWNTWGPPAGAEPFTPVPAGAPPLPPHPPEPVPLDVTAPDASTASMAMPPPAQPYRPPARTTGATMSNQGDTNAAVLGSNQHSESAMRAIHVAIDELEQARAALMAAAQGSQNPSDFEDAARAISATIEHYREGLPKVLHAMSMVSDAAARR